VNWVVELFGRNRTRMKRRTRIFTDLNRASERIAVGRYEGNASSRAFGLPPRYSLGGLNYANRHERCGIVLMSWCPNTGERIISIDGREALPYMSIETVRRGLQVEPFQFHCRENTEKERLHPIRN